MFGVSDWEFVCAMGRSGRNYSCALLVSNSFVMVCHKLRVSLVCQTGTLCVLLAFQAGN